MKVNINLKKIYLIFIVAIFINLPQILLFNSSMSIYDIKSNYSYILYLALLNNFILTFIILWLFFFSKITLRVSSYILVFFNIIFCLYVYEYHIAVNGEILAEVINNTKFANSFIDLKQILIVLISFVLYVLLYEVILSRAISNIRVKSSISGFFLVLIVSLASYLATLAILNPLGGKAQNRLQMASITYVNFPKNILAIAVESLSYYFKGKYIASSNSYYKSRIDYYLQSSNPKKYTLNNNEPQTIIFVFGESLNASHLTANDYKRNTTPLLLKESNTVFIKNTVSCATTTSIAQPCISKGLTTHDINYTDNIFSKYLINNSKIKSFIHIFSNLGFKSTFITIGNNGNSLRLLENEATERKYLHQLNKNNKEKNIKYVENEFKKVLKETINNKNSKKLILIYLEGSHYIYDNNFDKSHEFFKPSMRGAIINNAKNDQDKREVINAYDNTIAYTDYIMNLIIKELEKSDQNAIFFYFSDHGNQLFDNKMTPHGMPYKIAKKSYYDVINPGAFIWFSNAWLNNINSDALKNASKYKSAPFSYDAIFSSVLDCAGVSSNYINKKLSLCSN